MFKDFSFRKWLFHIFTRLITVLRIFFFLFSIVFTVLNRRFSKMHFFEMSLFYFFWLEIFCLWEVLSFLAKWKVVCPSGYKGLYTSFLFVLVTVYHEQNMALSGSILSWRDILGRFCRKGFSTKFCHRSLFWGWLLVLKVFLFAIRYLYKSSSRAMNSNVSSIRL